MASLKIFLKVRWLFFADLGDGQMGSPGFTVLSTYIHGTLQQWSFYNGFFSTKETLISSQLIWKVLVLKSH